MTALGRLTWREPADNLLVSVHCSGTGWGITATWSNGRGGGAARDTREAALECVGEMLELVREGVARRAGRGGHG
jgi:hypothetical protein